MKSFILTLSLFITVNFFSQMNKVQEIHLWPGKVPNDTTHKHHPEVLADHSGDVTRLTNVTDPLLQVHVPKASKRNGAAVIICPGGGYGILAIDKEGTEIAAWLNEKGYTAFVLQYRVPNNRAGALQDLQRAIRVVRYHATKWKINPEKIGVMGFSAGAHLCARAGTHFNQSTYTPIDKADNNSCRPQTTVLIYPAYLKDGKTKHLSAEVTPVKNTPSIFLFQTEDDPYIGGGEELEKCMKSLNIPIERHYMPTGGHGYGMRKGLEAAEKWPLLVEKWLSLHLK